MLCDESYLFYQMFKWELTVILYIIFQIIEEEEKLPILWTKPQKDSTNKQKAERKKKGRKKKETIDQYPLEYKCKKSITMAK